MKTRLQIIAVLLCMMVAYVGSYVVFNVADYFNIVTTDHGMGYILNFFYEPLHLLERVLAKLLYHH